MNNYPFNQIRSSFSLQMDKTKLLMLQISILIVFRNVSQGDKEEHLMI